MKMKNSNSYYIGKDYSKESWQTLKNLMNIMLDCLNLRKTLYCWSRFYCLWTSFRIMSRANYTILINTSISIISDPIVYIIMPFKVFMILNNSQHTSLNILLLKTLSILSMTLKLFYLLLISMAKLSMTPILLFNQF